MIFCCEIMHTNFQALERASLKIQKEQKYFTVMSTLLPPRNALVYAKLWIFVSLFHKFDSMNMLAKSYEVLSAVKAFTMQFGNIWILYEEA
jgi:hypothetical protein